MNVLIPSQICNKWLLIKRTDLAKKIMTVAISHYESSVAPPPPPQIPVAAGKEEAMLDTRCFISEMPWTALKSEFMPGEA